MKLFKFSIVIFFLFCFILSGCAEQYSHERIKRDTAIRMIEYKAESMTSGTSKNTDELVAKAHRAIFETEEYDSVINDSSFIFEVKRHARNLKDIQVRYGADLLFIAGKQYKEKNEFDKAKEVYKDIIRIFMGSAWAGYRDRARMEMDELK